MTKAEALQFFGRLQKLMRQSGVWSIESSDGRVRFYNHDGKGMCGFESLDLSSEDIAGCMTDASWKEF